MPGSGRSAGFCDVGDSGHISKNGGRVLTHLPMMPTSPAADGKPLEGWGNKMESAWIAESPRGGSCPGRCTGFGRVGFAELCH